MHLLFHDFQDLHGAGLDADAAGNALGYGAFGLENHNLHGASLHTGTAANAVLLVDHVHAGLGILGNGLMRTGLHALAALDADIGLCAGSLRNDLDAGIIGIELLIERLGAGTHALQTSHTFGIFLNSELLHN